MALDIATFDNTTGGNVFFKAVSHPLAADMARALISRLVKGGPVAIYDPLGIAAGINAFYDLARLDVRAVFVQDIGDIGKTRLGHKTQPVTELSDCNVSTVLVCAFDSERVARQVAHLIPAGATMVTLDEIRIPASMLSIPGRYLDAANFATNLAFFRDNGGLHTRLVTTNYWSGVNGIAPALWARLFAADGSTLVEWRESLGAPGSTIVLDSGELRRRWSLPEFTGQLFLHAIGLAGHDVVKYALDTFSDDGMELSCTHDANAWPADKYAGLPAPKQDERVILWVQNSSPCAIPPRAIGFNVMGEDELVALDCEIAPFASYPVDIAKLLPGVSWPKQIEIQAGRYFVRPRYEIERRAGRRRIAHVNVERVDLKPDPALAEIGNLLGKGFILPGPILPPERWRSIALPTPMATCQRELPIATILIDASGREIARHRFGRLPRNHATALDLTEAIDAAGGLPSGYGHMELVYDFSDGGEADGWLHSIFRYEDRASGHAADTSFGAHVFNTVLTYKLEPQSYTNRPPGLSTRLFLRLGAAPFDTMCHLIYPASTPWHETSQTRLSLHDERGEEIATQELRIPCGGSRLWRFSEMFAAADRRRVGDTGYVIIRDPSCRLFGYHGLLNGSGAFSLDHMFGF